MIAARASTAIPPAPGPTARTRPACALAPLTVAALALAGGAVADDAPLRLPSAPHDILREVAPGGATGLVLRYVLPDLSATPYESVLPVLDALCARDGLPLWHVQEPHVDEIVVIAMDRAIPRGQPMPEAVQYISAYAIEGEGSECLWQ